MITVRNRRVSTVSRGRKLQSLKQETEGLPNGETQYSNNWVCTWQYYRIMGVGETEEVRWDLSIKILY